MSGVIREQQHGAVIDLDLYSPFFITALSNSLASGASRTYRRLFGIGIGEWRLMTMLAIQPGLPLQVVADTIGVDKSAVSRSEGALSRQGYTRSEIDAADSRRKLVWLTPAGWDLHTRVLQVALAREALLLQGFDAEERNTLFTLLRRLLANTAALNDYDPAKG